MVEGGFGERGRVEDRILKALLIYWFCRCNNVLWISAAKGVEMTGDVKMEDS